MHFLVYVSCTDYPPQSARNILKTQKLSILFKNFLYVIIEVFAVLSLFLSLRDSVLAIYNVESHL